MELYKQFTDAHACIKIALYTIVLQYFMFLFYSFLNIFSENTKIVLIFEWFMFCNIIGLSFQYSIFKIFILNLL